MRSRPCGPLLVALAAIAATLLLAGFFFAAGADAAGLGSDAEVEYNAARYTYDHPSGIGSTGADAPVPPDRSVLGHEAAAATAMQSVGDIYDSSGSLFAPSGAVGSGPRPGVLTAAPDSRSVAQINSHPGGVEYVFDPDSGVFALGSRSTSAYRGGLSPHEQLADAIGASSETVVGGIARRHADGLLYFDTQSGHFWQNWTASNRAAFLEALGDYGVHNGGFG